MPFTVIDVKPSAKARPPATVSIGNRNAGRRMIVVLSPDTVKQTTFKKGDRFNAMLGDGEDRGLLRLQRDAAGALIPRETRNGGAQFRFKAPACFDGIDEKRVGCLAERIDDNTVQVTLPAWARAERKSVTVTPPRPNSEHIERQRRLGMR